MSAVQYIWFVLVLVGCSAADNKCQICVLTDVKCMTKGAVSVFANVIAGSDGLKPLDPLYIEQIDGQKGSTKYNLYDIVLTGLRACKVTKLDVNVNDTIYKHHVYCPKLISTFNVEVHDAEEDHHHHHPHHHHPHHPHGRQHVTVTAHDYESVNVGNYVILVNEKDYKPHVFLKDVNASVTLKGKLTFDIENRPHVESKPTNHCHKWTDGIEYLNSLIVKRAMEIVMMGGMQAYCKEHNMSELFPKTKNHTNCKKHSHFLQVDHSLDIDG